VNSFKSYLHSNTTFLVSLVGLIISVLAIVGWYYHNQKSHLATEQLKQLSIISATKAHAITAWRKGHLANARILNENSIFSNSLAKLVHSPPSRETDKMLKGWLDSLQKNCGYYYSSLLDVHQHVIAGVNAGEGEVGPQTRKLARQSLKTGSIIFSDFHVGPHFRVIHLDLIIPFYANRGKRKIPVGTLVLRIDPSSRLYPLLTSWPTPSKTAESVLLQKEADHFVSLLATRQHQAEHQLTGMPVSDRRLAAALRTAKPGSVFETTDAEGTAVLMTINPVPDTPWFLVTKIDRNEFFRPIRKEAGLAALVALALITASGIGIWKLWRHHGKSLRKLLLEKESESRRAEAAVIESERKYRRLVEDAVLGVYQTTPEGRVISANPAYIRMFGYDSLADIHANVADIARDLYCDPSHRDSILRLMKEHPGLATFEVPFRRKDGTTFIGNLHIRMERDKEGKLVILEGFVEDVTEKKKAAEEIARSEQKFRAIFENARDAIFLISDDARYVDCNPAAAQIFGCNRENLLGKNPHFFSPACQPDGKASVEKASEIISEVLNGQTKRFEWLHQRLDGTRFDAVVVLNRFEIEGEPMLLAIVRDVSEPKRMEHELRLSEARFRELSDMLPEVIFEADLTGKLTYANKDAFEKYGYVEQELAQGIHISQLVIPEDRGRLAEAMGKKLSGQKTDPYGGEYTTLRKDGTTLPVIVYSKPILHDGTPVGIRGIVVDITERIAFETRIKGQAAQLRAMMDHLPFDFWTLGADGRYCFQNNLSKKLWGDFSGKSAADVAPTRELAELWLNNNKRALAGNVVNGEVEYETDDGVRTCINILAPMVDGDSVLGAVGVNIDITEHRRAIEQIRFQASLLDQVRNAVVACDLEWKITYWNRYAETLYQWTESDALGQQIHNLVIPEENRQSYRAISARIEQTGAWEGETVVRKRDGTKFSIFMTTTALTSTDGKRTGYVGISVDISERIKLEEQLLHAQKMEAIGRLAGGVAHDFNNILTAILGYGQMLSTRQSPGSPEKQHAELILSSAEKAAELTRSLLAFSRKEINHPKLFDLNDIIRKTTKLLSRLIGEDIELLTDLVNSPLVAMVDGGQIEQVLMNLATNARDAMPGGGKIVIKTDLEYLGPEKAQCYGIENPGSHVKISFTDDGIGIPEKAREKIFDPFFTTKEVGKGTGLGLSIVHGIVLQHNGCIRLESSPGKGATFHIYLPAGTDEAGADKTVPRELPAGGTETILLAEDDDMVRNLNKYILESSGYRVVSAKDGQDAMDKFIEHRTDVRLLLLDVVMPEKNGVDVYNEIVGMRPDVKALFVSGYTADIMLGNGLTGNGLNFIPKPVSPTEMLTTVREILDSTAP